jgi:hypothetical protein
LTATPRTYTCAIVSYVQKETTAKVYRLLLYLSK